MPRRPCLDCGALTDRTDSRCTTCASSKGRARDARRGSARQRGYDTEHDRVRARLLPAAYGQPCPRCGLPMLRGQALDLGHPLDAPLASDRGSRADHIEHASCNRGGRVSHSA